MSGALGRANEYLTWTNNDQSQVNYFKAAMISFVQDNGINELCVVLHAYPAGSILKMIDMYSKWCQCDLQP